MSVGEAGAVKSATTLVATPVPLTAVSAAAALVLESVITNENVRAEPSVSVPSSVRVRVPAVPDTEPVAALPSIVPVTVDPASASNDTVTTSLRMASVLAPS